MLHTSTASRWRTALVGALVATVSLLPSAVAEKTQADYFIHDLPGAPEGPLLKMHAGHIEVDAAHNSNLFFWHYQNRHIADRQRTVLWLNGGPGCSSMDGAMMEVGPYRVREGGNLEYNNGSWDEFANLLFVDQPVGTGFSYVNTDSYLTDLDQMADHMMTFLEKWFALFPEYEHDDLYIAGESYAGQHIPYIARAILNRNKNQAKRQWNLKGLLIGNGWMSPVDQYLAYLPFAYQNGMLQADTDAARRVEQQQAICIKKLNDGGHNHVDTSECEQIMVNILEETKDRKADRMNQCVNMYDIRLRDDASCGMNWPPDLTDVTPYLRRPDVIQALNINSDKKTGWSECNGAVSGHFRAKNSEPTVKFMPELLAQVPVLLFSGDKDFICNHMGTEAMIENMSWNGGKGFELSSGVWAPKQDWTFEGEPAGTYQEVRNLTYVVFYNSSHMVPFDYPRRTRDMLDRFMQVDISAIGGNPSDSRIDGEKGPLTSVGGHPNSTQAEEDKTKQLKEAEWKAYYRSGEVVLVILIIVAGAWGIFLWRSRRANSTYKGDDSDEGRESLLTGMGLDNFRRRERRQDIEAADFDERELDDLDDGPKKSANGYKEVNEKDRHPANDSTFSLGADSDDEAEGSERGRRKEHS
ncbi:pheromone-processing carboxypeptidase KEX1 [Paraphoma chrysanthemicola]|nr:pheromone-processing carboxypeptidase KEX1 [Paraphoma chrysanthemicola]